ncbi:MAG TPA: GyrI-like domain-containing protein [Methanotrichaceae archaeon]|nr:GyrI-like domain-containing protein [Methanotrichaceae archaeon]
MKLDIKVIDVEEQPVLSIRETASMPSIPERMGQIFCEIGAFLEKSGIGPAGAPFAYWHGMTEESIQKGVFDMECGFPVSQPADGQGRIMRSKLPGGKVLTAMHIGPYETLAETYQALQSWAAENGYQAGEDMWEVYLTNPDEVPDKSRWMTQIFWLVK